ncbi:hypothetical protein ABAC460_18150 [Asticcacaulis sp. AC460]|nr:hypothetical protein ABAC460_18150 [Asticcacaulis sp. AC460]
MLRLYLLRACYLVLVVGLAWQFWTRLPMAAAMPLTAAAVTVMLSALGLLSVLGVLAPLKFLPLILFELTWKLIWCLTVALPRWQAGTIDAETANMLFAVALVVPFAFVVPWSYVVKTYVRGVERWRVAA